MIILGIHAGHDSSAAIVRDGEVLADVAEERFTRLKHCNHVPIHSIAYCLKMAGLSDLNEVDYVAVSWKDAPAELGIVLGLYEESPIKKRIKRVMGLGFSLAGFAGLGVETRKLPIYYPDLRLRDRKKLIPVEHHLGHAASAYYTRGTNDRCLIFTLDGAGDGVSTAVWVGEGTEIKPLQKLSQEASIGYVYSVVTEALHWWHGDGEGKTMGLAPYGDATKCKGVLDRYFPIMDGTQLVRPAGLARAYYWVENGAMQFHFDEAYEVEKLVKQFGRENIAAEAQRKLEEVVLEYVFGWVSKAGCPNTAYAGGVFLNVKLNQRIWYKRADRIREQYVFPNAGDSGLAMGAALSAYYKLVPFTGHSLEHLYLGPEYSADMIENLLKERSLKYEQVAQPTQKAAQLLADNKIVAWFQGRMESGPRALGNRSILMSPLVATNKDIINARVKFREAFRPFCPSLLWEKRHDYLVDSRDEFFMITSFDVTDNKKDRIPAVVHVDGTVRPQMVKREVNPLYWDLINEFGRLTGEYIILNTSFNIRGEPIINTPSEAIRCFFDSGLDALFLGNFLLLKDR
jgi:carbamoyltransferase